MDKDAHSARLREFMRRFFKPHTPLAPSAISKAVGFSTSVLIAFLLPDDSPARRGRPRAESLTALAPEIRQRLEMAGYSELARECTAVRLLIEGGYLRFEDLQEFLETEGLEGWMRTRDCISDMDLEQLSPHARTMIQDIYAFNLLQAGRIMPAASPDEGGEPAPAT